MARQRLTMAALLLCAAVAAAQPQSIDDLRKRADAGDPAAQFTLGEAYELGRGIGRDMQEAERWYRKAADAGHAKAQYYMGSLHQERKQYDGAALWYRKAAEQNQPAAINGLGYLHDLGLGMPQDRSKGAELYLRAANLGWSEGMWNLAEMYAAGQLGAKDMQTACAWAMRAWRFAAGDRSITSRAQRAQDIFKRQLGAANFERCQQDAESWQPAGATAATGSAPAPSPTAAPPAAERKP